MTSTTSTTLGRNAIGAYVASQIMEAAAKHVLKTWNPKRHQGITPEQALEAARQVFGYVSPNAWSYTDPHPFYGVRNVGRPAPKSAPAAKSTARTGRTAAKSAPARTATAAKSAPRTTARKGTPPAAKSAAKSTARTRTTAK